MKKEMLINVLQPEECRIAIVEDGILEFTGPGQRSAPTGPAAHVVAAA